MTSELKRMISEGAEPKDVAMAFIKSMKGKGKGKTTTRQEPVEGSGWLDKKKKPQGALALENGGGGECPRRIGHLKTGDMEAIEGGAQRGVSFDDEARVIDGAEGKEEQGS